MPRASGASGSDHGQIDPLVFGEREHRLRIRRDRRRRSELRAAMPALPGAQSDTIHAGVARKPPAERMLAGA